MFGLIKRDCDTAGQRHGDGYAAPVSVLFVLAASFVLVSCETPSGKAPCKVPDSSPAKVVDRRLEDLRFSSFCTDAAAKFWQRHEWKDQNEVKHITAYTSHYNKQMNKCLVDVHEVTLIDNPFRSMEGDYVYDALENGIMASHLLVKIRARGDERVESDVMVREGHRIPGGDEERTEFTSWFGGLMSQ